MPAKRPKKPPSAADNPKNKSRPIKDRLSKKKKRKQKTEQPAGQKSKAH
jgi:hypothetical protein